MEVLTLGPDATLAQVQQMVTGQRHAMGSDAMPVAMHADVVCADTGQAVQWLQDHANGMVLPAVLYHDEAMRPEPMDDAALDERLRGLRAKLRARDRAWWKTHKPANGMVECPQCRSMLNVEYCGVRGGWWNRCPVCHGDVRPEQVARRFDEWKHEYQRLRDLRNRQTQMPAYPVCWLVAVSMQEPATVRITPQ